MTEILLTVIIILLIINIVIALTKNNRLQTERLEGLLREEMKENRDELGRNIRELRNELNQTLNYSIRNMQDTLHKNLLTGNEMQREKFEAMGKQQEALVKSTEKRLDDMRQMVEEKLQKTLNERIGQSFEIVRSQLENVQKGLGEMKSLAQDVGGLKKVLSNVKTRGTFGEVQLGALLDQMLSPEQYAANVKTKKNATEFVEFAIKLPGKENSNDTVYLPVDAKFPKDVYEQYQDAYEAGYQLPKTWLSKVMLKSARLNLTAENLFMLKARQGLNPMANYSGVTYNEYMPSRNITLGLNVSF